jgi:phosphate transport system permease protein
LHKLKDQQGQDNNHNNKTSGRSGHRRAIFYDKAAKIIILSGGIATIIAVLGILAFVFYEAYPLWFGSKAELDTKLDASEIIVNRQPLLIGIDEYQEIAYVVTDSATIDFIDLKRNSFIKSISIAGLEDEKIISVSRSLSNYLIGVGTASGKIGMLKLNFTIRFLQTGERIIEPEAEIQNVLLVDSLKRAVTKVAYRLDYDSQPSFAAVVNDSELILYSQQRKRSLLEPTQVQEFLTTVGDFPQNSISAIELDDFCEKLMIGTTDGNLYYYSVKAKDKPVLIQKIMVTESNKTSVTALSFIIGDQTLIVGDEKGNVSSWMRILDDKSVYGWKMVRSHKFNSLSSSVTQISPSPRNKSFIAAGKDGIINVNHLTSERTLLELSAKSLPIKDVAFSPKSNGALVLYEDNSLAKFEIESPHPEITLKTVFGKVWYEGYQKPEFVWQSSGGTDDFEPKFSLIPLIVGTLKGTFYALIFAIPIALLGALYTSSFSHPRIKNIIKPTVEIMAALPSVVIGFLAGLWLAPLLEKILPGVILIFILSPLMVFGGFFLSKKIPQWMNFKLKPGFEIILIVPLLLIGIQISLWLGPFFEQVVFGGDYRQWLLSALNEQYDQRNSIVVGFAMGFAVIPIIFTICEDSLSSVPQHLTSASLALGATRWQTALRVVLPTASPGIFSAIMIGFGRAIGETMIVLMATGNTPIMDFSPFNGMRTLSANIAVEIPEAPYHGTLYRVLFLSATLLFIMTFFVNTAAEIVRQRLRKKFMDV